MAQKTVGYVELEWVCPNCKSRNKGSQKTCLSCGAAQPENVEFINPEKQELIQDPAALEKAQIGPDIHCAYCGARNPANGKTCSNCGADLGQGKQREAGQVVGAFTPGQTAESICATCGSKNPTGSLKCTTCGAPLANPGSPQVAQPQTPAPASKPNIFLILLGAAAVFIVIIILMNLFTEKDLVGVVTQRSWKRSVVVEQFGPVRREDWKDELPSDAKIVSCTDKFRTTSSQPQPKSTEVCSTAYTKDQGSGFGKVVQDCTYYIYAQSCSYEINAWTRLRDETLQGTNTAPAWPAPQLSTNQRLGSQDETYLIVFDTPKTVQKYTTSDMKVYNEAVQNSRWTLKVNGFGSILSIQPAP